VSREAIGLWVNRFGGQVATCIRRARPRATDKRPLDEVAVAIGGVSDGLWRAFDADGEVRDIPVQPRRNAKAAKRFFKRLTPSRSAGAARAC
jgi:putative transposase